MRIEKEKKQLTETNTPEIMAAVVDTETVITTVIIEIIKITKIMVAVEMIIVIEEILKEVEITKKMMERHKIGIKRKKLAKVEIVTIKTINTMIKVPEMIKKEEEVTNNQKNKKLSLLMMKLWVL